MIGAGAVLAACEIAFRAVGSKTPVMLPLHSLVIKRSCLYYHMYWLLSCLLAFGLALVWRKSSCSLLEVKIRCVFKLHGLYGHYW